jgi:hypothetical protein
MPVFYVKSFFYGVLWITHRLFLFQYSFFLSFLISDIVWLCTKLGLLVCLLRVSCFDIWFVFFGFGLCFVCHVIDSVLFIRFSSLFEC